MKDFYKHTREVIDRYNQVVDNIINSPESTNEEDDEFHQNHYIHLAHALIKDFGYGQCSREELRKMADIINVVVD